MVGRGVVVEVHVLRKNATAPAPRPFWSTFTAVFEAPGLGERVSRGSFSVGQEARAQGEARTLCVVPSWHLPSPRLAGSRGRVRGGRRLGPHRLCAHYLDSL